MWTFVGSEFAKNGHVIWDGMCDVRLRTTEYRRGSTNEVYVRRLSCSAISLVTGMKSH